jgi:hypothetical protein
MSRWLCLLRRSLAALFIVLPASRAAALDWVVVPYGVSHTASATRAADRLVRALAERRLLVASTHELKDLFQRRSRAHLTLDPQLARTISDARKRALEHAAFGRRDAARRAAEEAMRGGESAPEAALRDSDLARYVLDACLAVVRVDLQERDRPLAVRDAHRCRHLVPDLAPRESTHSAEVVGALAEAENELRRAGAGALIITSDASETCGVFVNGRRLGTTPFRYEHAPLGPTTVFLECGSERSRVHPIQLGEHEQTLLIDAGHDVRIDDRDVVALVYRSEQEVTEHLATDTLRLAESLSAPRIIMVRELPQGRFEAVRFDYNRKRLVATVQIDAEQLLGPSPQAAQQAAEALALERQDAPIPLAYQPRPQPPAVPVVPVSPPVSALPVAEQPPPPALAHGPAVHTPRRRAWTWGFGAATVAAGGAALGLGLVVNRKLSEYDTCVNGDGDNCNAVQRHGDRFALGANVALGIAGGFALATVSAFFVEGRKRRAIQGALRLGPAGVVAVGAF